MAQGAGRKANKKINVFRFTPGALLFPPAASGKIGGQKIRKGKMVSGNLLTELGLKIWG
jgi:hypothetical protein